MELVVAVNPTSFSDEEFSSIAGALAELKSRRAIPKNRKLKLVRTTRVESIAWFKKHDSDEKVGPLEAGVPGTAEPFRHSGQKGPKEDTRCRVTRCHCIFVFKNLANF